MMQQLLSLSPFLLIIPIFYFMLIRPQRKREKADADMRKGVVVGDTITTIGGVIGKVTNIKDDTITIETGSGNEKSRIRLARWAVRNKDTAVAENLPEPKSPKAKKEEIAENADTAADAEKSNK